MSRGFKITRSDYSDKDTSDRVGWIDDFARNLEKISNSAQPKSAVEVARNRNQQSILDQISQIVSRKTITTKSVETAVLELQDRIGLNDYLKRVSASAAVSSVNEKPQQRMKLQDIFKDMSPDSIKTIEDFIYNTIEYTHHGNTQPPAIVESVKNNFKDVQATDVNNPLFEKYVSDVISDSQKRNPIKQDSNQNIGRGVGLSNDTNDTSNTNFFGGIMPNKQ